MPQTSMYSIFVNKLKKLKVVNNMKQTKQKLEGEEAINKYISSQKPKTTAYKDTSDIKRFKKFFSEP